MSGTVNTADAASDAAAEAKRFQSGLTFPYSDLEATVELAQTLHSRAGTSAEPDELAAWMNQSASGGTFRTRVSAAKLFGLVDTGQGRITLTQLGRDILNGSGNERAARVDAFLRPELFRLMYEQNKGNPLPPAAAVERQMEQLGISPKQKERARQTFTKSAQYAGFIDSATGRFIKPGIGATPKEEVPAVPDAPKGGGGGGEPPDIDPIIQGLLARLPKSGDVWPKDQRKLWLQLLEGSFDLIYKNGPNGSGATHEGFQRQVS